MKKLLLGAGIAMSVLLASCGGSTSAPTNFTDSLATIFGEYQGSALNENFTNNIPESERAHYKKEDVIRGFKEVILADTAAQGYYAGLNIALNMNQTLLDMEKAGINIDRPRLVAALAKAFMADSVGDMEKLQTEFSAIMGQVQTRVMEYQNKKMEEQRAAARAEAEANEAAGQKYIAEQKAADPAIQTTESGLSYKVVKQGEGAKPGPNDKVKVIYTGRLVDGTEFDSSKGEPIEFTPAGTVPGFSEGLQMMNAGSEYVLYIPAALAYGDRAVGSIPANSTLVFDVKVVGVE